MRRQMGALRDTDINRVEIPQRSTLLLFLKCAILAPAREVLGSETAQFGSPSGGRDICDGYKSSSASGKSRDLNQGTNWSVARLTGPGAPFQRRAKRVLALAILTMAFRATR